MRPARATSPIYASCARRAASSSSRSDGAGKLQIELFEKYAEHTFMDPTFVYAYPTEVSPLSRANDADPFLTDRFEFFVAGRELANGFSELNDAEDQAARFRAQVERKDAGDDEAMYYDADYVRALEYGMPPTAGLGVGIDRLVMFFTDAPSIRDVLLFPHMRPENRRDSNECAHRSVRLRSRRTHGAARADCASFRTKTFCTSATPRVCPTAPRVRKPWRVIRCAPPRRW